MKNLTLIVSALLLLSVYSCNKSDNDGPSNAGNGSTTRFSVNGLTDINLKANLSADIPLEVAHNSGNQETVTLTISDLPANVTAEFSASSGIPTYNTVLTLTADNATEGSYGATITAKNQSGNENIYPFTINIQPAEDCAEKMVGSYGGSTTCFVGGLYKIEKVPGTTNEIIIKENGSSYIYADVKAVLDCSSNTVTIPEQTTQDNLATYQVKGTGTYTAPNSINFSLEWSSTTVNTQNCNYTLVK